MVGNLVALYNQVPADVRENGQKWYHDVRAQCKSWGDEFNVSVEQVAGVISALSPRTSWTKNLTLARQVMVCWKGGSWQDALALPTMKRGIAHAWKILDGDLGTLNGPKTRAFMDNIAHEDSSKVTVDVWAVRAAKFDFDAPYKDITGKYSEYEEAYLEGAWLTNLRGYEFQAIVWVWVRYVANTRNQLTQLTLL